MIIARSKEDLESVISRFKEKKSRIGFVPTMGALHEGHLSLVKWARKPGTIVAVSIFVNPTQFAPHEDFSTYPRQEEKDLALLQEHGVDLVYLPKEQDLYPQGKEITVKAGDAAKGLESDFRAHFFDGVATVVYRLFTQIQADTAVFGEKDFQQLQVIREMAEQQGLSTQIIGGPTVRDNHGLALSSRNAYLDAEEYHIACRLNGILQTCAAAISQEAHNARQYLEQARKRIMDAGFDRVDYVDLRWGRVLAAAWLGRTRLIDNIACPEN